MPSLAPANGPFESRAASVASLRDVVAVLATAVALAVLSNVLIPLPFTPVPISLATFGVLAAAGTLGPVRAGAGAAFFLLGGIAGIPWFAGEGMGWSFPTFGYIVGYVLAAVVVGALVRRRTDGRALPLMGAMLVGSSIIYLTGAPWLMLSLGVGVSEAFQMGVLPFLIGDALKSLAAAGITYGAFQLRR